jgi:hypothetical protein
MSAPNEESPFVPRVEEDEVPGRRLWVAAAVVGLVTVASLFVADRMLRASGGASLAQPTSPAPHASNQIGIVEQTLIRTTRRGLDERDAQRASLQRFRWVDRAHQVAAVPIDRAMDLVTDPAFMRRAFAHRPAGDDALRDGGT